MTTYDATRAWEIIKALPHRFYVYGLHAPDGAIFYVGKGHGRRAFAHVGRALRAEQTRRCQKIRSIMETGGTVLYSLHGRFGESDAAYDAQSALIKAIGLTALTNERVRGARLTEEARRKIAATLTGRRGAPHSEQSRALQSAIRRGYWQRRRDAGLPLGYERSVAALNAHSASLKGTDLVLTEDARHARAERQRHRIRSAEERHTLRLARRLLPPAQVR